MVDVAVLVRVGTQDRLMPNVTPITPIFAVKAKRGKPIIGRQFGTPVVPPSSCGFMGGTPFGDGSDSLHGGTPSTFGTDVINANVPC